MSAVCPETILKSIAPDYAFVFSYRGEYYRFKTTQELEEFLFEDSRDLTDIGKMVLDGDFLRPEEGLWLATPEMTSFAVELDSLVCRDGTVAVEVHHLDQQIIALSQWQSDILETVSEGTMNIWIKHPAGHYPIYSPMVKELRTVLNHLHLSHRISVSVAFPRDEETESFSLVYILKEGELYEVRRHTTSIKKAIADLNMKHQQEMTELIDRLIGRTNE